MTVILYDGECPFCTSITKFYELKARFPDIKIISMRDADQLRNLDLPADLDFNRGMILIENDGTISQGEPAFQKVNSKVQTSSLADRFKFWLLSWRPATRLVYPMLFYSRLVVLKWKNVENHLRRVDLDTASS